MVEAKVKYSYNAEEDDELDLEPGDIITNIQKKEGGWWEGDLNGKRGVFPDNFVEEIQQNEFKERKSVKRLSAKLQEDLDFTNMGSPLNSLSRTPSKKASIKRARAKVTFSYQADNDDELNLEVGQILDVFQQVEEGWWEGELEGKQGVFPSNFVELIEGEILTTEYVPMHGNKTDEYIDMTVSQTLPENEVETEMKADEEDGSLVTIKKHIGMGFGNLINPDMLQRKLQQSKIKSEKEDAKVNVEKEERPKPLAEERPVDKITTKKQEKRQAPGVPLPDQAGWKPPVLKAKVRFPYNPEQEDELGLAVGDILTVLKKDVSDGWCEGELNGKVGVFPDNFVDFLPIEQEELPKKELPPVPLPVKKPVPPAPSPVKPQIPGPPAQNTVRKQPPPPPVEKKSDPPEVKKPEQKSSPLPIKKSDPPEVKKLEQKSSPVPIKKPVQEKPKPPMIPGKPRPPTGRKPDALPKPPKPGQKPVPTKPTEDDKPKEVKPAREVNKTLNKTKEKEEDAHDFDCVTSQEKLVHLTADRAKGPFRNPPNRFSAARISRELVDDDAVDAGISNDVSQEKPSWVKELQNKKAVEPVKPESAPVQEKPKKDEIPKKILPGRPEPPKPESLPQSTTLTQASTKVPPQEISNDLVKELMNEIKKLTEKIDSMETKFEKDLSKLEKNYETKLEKTEEKFQQELADLTSELDEEKKQRVTLEVEIQRLKKDKLRGNRLTGDS